jgi:hypothetical protein
LRPAHSADLACAEDCNFFACLKAVNSFAELNGYAAGADRAPFVRAARDGFFG